MKNIKERGEKYRHQEEKKYICKLGITYFTTKKTRK